MAWRDDPVCAKRMAEKKFKGAPFGTQAARFDVSAVHPANKRAGTYTQIPYCKKMTSESERNLGPGTYNPDVSDFGPKAVQERAKGPGWRRAQEKPGLLYREAWDNKHLLKTKLGPGTYKTCDFIEELNKKPCSIRGVCDSREERFRETRCFTPGPGTYGKGGVPWAAMEVKRVKSAGTKPSVVFGSGLERFSEGKVDDVGLSPDTYDIKSFTELLLDSNMGKRGPCDLSTVPRDKPICFGYFADPKRVNLNPGQYTREMPKFGEDLETPGKRKHGVFSTLEQYPAVPTNRIFHSTLSHCKRPATSPGPGWYNVTPVSRPGSRSAPPFLSSASRVSSKTERFQCIIGPGNYNITEKNQKSISGHQSIFNSKTQRYLHSPHRDKYKQERLRPINVGLARTAFAVTA